MRKRIVIYLIMVSLSGCSFLPKTEEIGKGVPPEPEVEKPPSSDNRPKDEIKKATPEVPGSTPPWVWGGTGVFASEASREKGFYGVGQTPAQEKASGDKARNHLVEVVKRYSQNLVQYFQDLFKKSPGKEVSRKRIEEAIHSASALALLDTELVDRWENPENQKIYSRAYLKFKKLQKRLISVSSLTAEEVDLLKKGAALVFAQMQKEEERIRLFTSEKIRFEPKAGRFYLH